MEARLVPINAFISMCRHDDGWPSPLADVGFHLSALEVPMTTESGSTTLDAVAFKETTNVVLSAEAKSGANVDADQAKKVMEVDGPQLVQMAGLSVRIPGDVIVEAAYVCLAEHAERIKQGLTVAECWPPVLVVGVTELRHDAGSFHTPDLEQAFAAPIQVPGPPPRYVTLDVHSSDADFDREVRASLVKMMSQQRPGISVAALVEEAIPHHPMFGTKAREVLRRKVQESARRVADAMPDQFRYRAPNGTRRDPWIEVRETPESADPRGRTQRWQKVTRDAGGRRRRRRDTGTLELPFDAIMEELGAGEEADEAEPDEAPDERGDEDDETDGGGAR